MPARKLIAAVAILSSIAAASVFVSPAAAVSRTQPIDLDVMFIGAHPDDELFNMPAFGQWKEYDDADTGVITITRGEGGGNAVGLEEGPALGLLREDEERRALAWFDQHNIYYLDKVDFYYNVSAPLTETAWGHQSTLERVVRLIRETRPDIVTTMNPSPTPGNHGHHQYAARMAVEAFYAASDPNVFPKQITEEGLEPFQIKKVFLSAIGVTLPGAVNGGFLGGLPVIPVDSNCEPVALFGPQSVDETDTTYSVSGDRMSQKHGRPWGSFLGPASQEYASQGFRSQEFETLFTGLGTALCNIFVQVDTRVPFTPGNNGADDIFEGATVPAGGGLPLGTEFYLVTDAFRVVAGEPFTITAYAREAPDQAGSLSTGTVSLTLPQGWTSEGDGVLQTVGGPLRNATFTITPSAAAAPGRQLITGELTVGSATGTTNEVVQVVPPVVGTMQPLPHVAQFREWARQVGVPQLDTLLVDRQSIAVGETRIIDVVLENFSDVAQSGTAEFQVQPVCQIDPLLCEQGFTVTPAAQAFTDLAPGATTAVQFTVTNSDESFATSNQGGSGGDYAVNVVAKTTGGTSTVGEALNLVPSTTIPPATKAPTLDGEEAEGEYAGDELDVSRVWEGSNPDNADDASGTAKVVRTKNALFFVVHVNDDTLGTVLPPVDCKRHWRTDSVEITIDPKGDSENTSTTFKAGIFPTTDNPDAGNPPCFERDADNRQGPGPETAPHSAVASTVTDPYSGYTIEAKIAFADLPSSIDPEHMGLNILIYDSDNQNKQGDTRLAWSTWGGVQGDPYRWGRALLPDYAPADMPVSKPLLKFPVARSVNSPQSILQTALDGVPLAGFPRAGGRVKILQRPALDGETLALKLASTAPGWTRIFAWTGTQTAARTQFTLKPGRPRTVALKIPASKLDELEEGYALISYRELAGRGTRSIAIKLQP